MSTRAKLTVGAVAAGLALIACGAAGQPAGRTETMRGRFPSSTFSRRVVGG